MSKRSKYFVGQMRARTSRTRGELGEIKKMSGDVASARTLLEQSVAEWRAMDNRSIYAADAIRPLADVLVASDDLPRARRAYEEALGLTKEMPRASASWAMRVRITELELEEGHPKQAEEAATRIRAEINEG